MARIKDMIGALKVRDIMRRDYVSVNASASVMRVVKNEITQHDYSVFPVERGKRIVGLVTVTMIRKVPRSQWNDIRVSDIMVEISARNSLHQEEKAVAALTKLVKTKLDVLPVLENGTCKGVLTQDDLLDILSNPEETGSSMHR
jgi:CBS domain-containing protein